MAIRITPAEHAASVKRYNGAQAQKARAEREDAERKPGRPSSGKQVVSLRLDPDIIEAFRATGPGWQARINETLRRHKP